MPCSVGLRSGKGAPLRGRLRRPCLCSRPSRHPGPRCGARWRRRPCWRRAEKPLAPQGILTHGQYGQSRQREYPYGTILVPQKGAWRSTKRKGRKRNEDPSNRRVPSRAGDNAYPERGTVGRGAHPRRHCPAGVGGAACPAGTALLRGPWVFLWVMVSSRGGRSLRGRK